jgi:tRNA-Thr(GGU) m(6)t(6)A37 methyltransferase TsaA
VNTLTAHSIGIVQSEHTQPSQTPIQPACASGCRGRIEVFPEFEEALTDLEGLSRLRLIDWLNCSPEATNAVSAASSLLMAPFLDDLPQGVCAIRPPIRPNPIGLSVVSLIERNGADLIVDDIDVLEGTPLLDTKPYVDAFDLRLGTRGGWSEHASGGDFIRRGERLEQLPRGEP